MSETNKNVTPAVTGDVKPVVYVARENVRNNVKA